VKAVFCWLYWKNVEQARFELHMRDKAEARAGIVS